MAKTETREIELKPNLGATTVIVSFGDAVVGGYRLFLWDPKLEDSQQFGFGEKASLIPDRHTLGLPISELKKGYTIDLDALIETPEDKLDGPYSVTITITQLDKVSKKPITVGEETYTGKLENGSAVELQYILLK